MAINLELFDEYLNGENSPLFRKPEDLHNSDLTERKIDGKGTFDALMSSVYAHALGEYQKNRITGAEYAKVYSAMIEAAMGNAVQFLLQKENAYWQAVNGQLGALTARVQIDLAIKELDIKDKELVMMDKELEIKTQELLNQQKQLEILEEQLKLILEQAESQRAQTLNTRSDGAAVAGLIKSQKDLYQQQIDSYKRDAETKVGKLLIDTWTTQKTVDEGLTAPTQVSNANLDTLITALRSRNSL